MAGPFRDRRLRIQRDRGAFNNHFSVALRECRLRAPDQAQGRRLPF
jgi:hypothetical protein